MLKATKKSQLNVIMKMWLYNNAIIPKMTWEFTIYNFPITYVVNLEAICTKYLKRWVGISRCTTITALYWSRKKYGLQLKKLSTSVKYMQVTKYHLNPHSVDGSTQALYKNCIQKKAKQVRWNGVKELEQRERHLILNEMWRGQTDRAGLCLKKTQKLIKDMKPRQHRQSLTSLVKDVDEDDMLVYLYGCTKQGQWLKWESVMQVDTSLKKLLYVWTPRPLSFHFNAVYDQLLSPANLRLRSKNGLYPHNSVPHCRCYSLQKPSHTTSKDRLHQHPTKYQWLGISDEWRTQANNVPSSNSRNSQTSWYHGHRQNKSFNQIDLTTPNRLQSEMKD